MRISDWSSDVCSSDLSYTIGSSLGGKLGSRFKWEAFWQYGRVTDNVTEANVPWKSHWIAARDAIADPVTGEPVCRDATARAQGCVPFDIFSTPPATEAQIKWAMADRHERRGHKNGNRRGREGGGG